MNRKDTVWLCSHDGSAPIEVEAKPEVLIPWMVRGYVQCDPPEEVTEHVDR
jgi:hypothetical protein